MFVYSGMCFRKILSLLQVCIKSGFTEPCFLFKFHKFKCFLLLVFEDSDSLCFLSVCGMMTQMRDFLVRIVQNGGPFAPLKESDANPSLCIAHFMDDKWFVKTGVFRWPGR